MSNMRIASHKKIENEGLQVRNLTSLTYSKTFDKLKIKITGLII